MEKSRMDMIEKGMVEFFQGMKEMREFQKKTDEMFRRTDDHLMKLKESQEKTDEQLEKTIKKLDKIGEQLGDLGIVQGKVAEDLFYRNVKSLFKQRDMRFATVRRNVKKKGVAEYDIVAVDKDRVDVSRYAEKKGCMFSLKAGTGEPCLPTGRISEPENFPEQRMFRVETGTRSAKIKQSGFLHRNPECKN